MSFMVVTERGKSETHPRLSHPSHDGNVQFIPVANAFLDGIFAEDISFGDIQY